MQCRKKELGKAGMSFNDVISELISRECNIETLLQIIVPRKYGLSRGLETTLRPYHHLSTQIDKLRCRDA